MPFENIEISGDWINANRSCPEDWSAGVIGILGQVAIAQDLGVTIMDTEDRLSRRSYAEEGGLRKKRWVGLDGKEAETSTAFEAKRLEGLNDALDKATDLLESYNRWYAAQRKRSRNHNVDRTSIDFADDGRVRIIRELVPGQIGLDRLEGLEDSRPIPHTSSFVAKDSHGKRGRRGCAGGLD